MNYIFHDLIVKLVEIYIDDVVVMSTSAGGHLEDLRKVLERTQKFGLKMNPKKCAFGISAGQFLGFLVHERGIEIGLKSQEAVKTMKPPTTKKELQKLIGKINFFRQFISNLSGRIELFMGLVKIKSDDEFHRGGISGDLVIKYGDPYKNFRPDEELSPVLLQLLRHRLLPLLRSSGHRHRLLLLPCGRGSV